MLLHLCRRKTSRGQWHLFHVCAMCIDAAPLMNVPERDREACVVAWDPEDPFVVELVRGYVNVRGNQVCSHCLKTLRKKIREFGLQQMIDICGAS